MGGRTQCAGRSIWWEDSVCGRSIWWEDSVCGEEHMMGGACVWGGAYGGRTQCVGRGIWGEEPVCGEEHMGGRTQYVGGLSMWEEPRSDGFQEDIYPVTAANEPALTADEWLMGQNKGQSN
ncbi:unnamed protein product [Leuciscus chuanchicus]